MRRGRLWFQPETSSQKARPKNGVGQECRIELAKAAKLKKIELVAFDRGGYKYQGRIKALAEGAREGGLKF